MREAVSSTELLHERAMERFYRAIAVEEAVDEAKRQNATDSTNNDYPLFEQRILLRKKLHLTGAHSSLWQAKRDRRRCSDSQTEKLRVPPRIVPDVLEDAASDPNLCSIETKIEWNSQDLEIKANSGKVRTQYSTQIDYSEEYTEQIKVEEVDENFDEQQLSEPLRRWHDFPLENTFTPIEMIENKEKIDDQIYKTEEIETQSVETSIESSEEESSDEDLRQFRARILAIPVENEEDTYHPRGNPVRHVSPEKSIIIPPPVPPHRVQVIDPSSSEKNYSIPSPPMSPTNIIPKSILKKRVEPDIVPITEPIEILKSSNQQEMALSDIDNENVLSAAEVARNRRRQLKQLSKNSITSSDNEEEREGERMALVSHYTEIVNQFSMNHKPFPQRRVPIRNENINDLQTIERTLSPPRAKFDYSSDEKSSDNSQIYHDKNIIHQIWEKEINDSLKTETKRRGRSRIDESMSRSRNVSTERGESSRSSSKTRARGSRSSSKTRNNEINTKSIRQKNNNSRSNSRDRSRCQTPTEAKMERLQQRTQNANEKKQRSRRISTHERYENIDQYSKYLLEIQAERNVRSSFSYVTDVILLLAAVYVYLFKEAIFAIPIIGLILYRRIQQGVRDLIPKWLRGPKR